jgi:hypothetical protein
VYMQAAADPCWQPATSAPWMCNWPQADAVTVTSNVSTTPCANRWTATRLLQRSYLSAPSSAARSLTM